MKRAQITLDGLSHPYIPSTPAVEGTDSEGETTTSSKVTSDANSATDQTEANSTSNDNASTSEAANDASQNETQEEWGASAVGKRKYFGRCQRNFDGKRA